MEKIGNFNTIEGKYIVVFNPEEKETYVYKNPDFFFKADAKNKHRQKIIKKIGGVLFFWDNVLIRCFEDNAVEKHIKKHFPDVYDKKLKSLVHLCAGADCADWKIVSKIEEIESWTELKNISNLSTGLGFPGTGVSLLKVKQPIPFLPAFHLQIVDSYFEGYSVEHIPLRKELVNACNSEIIKKLFNIN